MDRSIRQYIQTAKLYFPILGKAERDYLLRLSDNIEDYFGEQPPSRVEDIIAVFGKPQTVISEYLQQSDVNSILKRIQHRKLLYGIRLAVVTLFLIVSVYAIIHLSFRLLPQMIQDNMDYPTYSNYQDVTEQE